MGCSAPDPIIEDAGNSGMKAVRAGRLVIDGALAIDLRMDEIGGSARSLILDLPTM